ncbi:MAG: undecaprenyl/decaprenyl-phosphate alpha-N-acetylglucosaminyl 1-phosphate transferase [Gammaproteobacteria bacterium]|nr:undecaprenyl/decaprenyl-phosphate alpha-N-acetylglucosaminyl 1-phosphate transferase [Gammaproteobacteria bacterium]
MQNFIIYCFAGVTTGLFLWSLRTIASRIGFVDHPCSRKAHCGQVPLVGGIAMFFGFILAVFVGGLINDPAFLAFIVASALLVGMGAIDDYISLSTRIRFIIQFIAAFIMVVWGGVVIEDLGALTGHGSIALGSWAVPFTIVAIVGMINAFNMTDGIDGLAGSLAMLAFSLMSILAFLNGQSGNGLILLLLASVVATFLLFNLRVGKREQALVFMGDAGSMFLGGALCWFAIVLTQGETKVVEPIAAIWILAIPLLDTLCLIIRRLRRGESPFSGGRDHLHHVLMDFGLSVNRTLLTIFSISILLGGFAVIESIFWNVGSYFYVISFLVLFAAYLWVMCLWDDQSIKTEVLA